MVYHSTLHSQIVIEYITSLLLHRYLSKYKLTEQTDNIGEFIHHLSCQIGTKRINGEVDVDNAARVFLRDYREGLLGRFTLDDISEGSLEEWFLRKDESSVEDEESKGLNPLEAH
jgi:ribosome biogenesis GTPase A